MKIPRDLNYILNRQNFKNAPWRRKRSVKESLERFVEEGLPFNLSSREKERFGKRSSCPPKVSGSTIRFGSPPRAGHDNLEFSEGIKFEPFAFHTGDEQPLRVREARELAEDGEDLEVMHIPVGSLLIPFGENFHTLTDWHFRSMVGKARKPFGLTWHKWDRSPPGFSQIPPGAHISSTIARKVEFLQECMVALRIVDPGSKSREEAAQVFSRLLNCRPFYADDTDEDLYRLNWNPWAPKAMHDAPGPNETTTRTFVQIPSDGSGTDYQTVQVRLMAHHEGDRKPIPVAKNKALDKDTDLMQVPMGYIGWAPSEKRQGAFEDPVNWTWTEDWEEPSDWIWADGWEKPIELTWRKKRGVKGTIQKIVFLRHYVTMIYIEDMGEGAEEDEVARDIEELAGIELRHSTNSLGEDYWWKVQHDGSSTNSSSRPSGHSKSSKAPSLLDLYGGDEQMASDAYNNIN